MSDIRNGGYGVNHHAPPHVPLPPGTKVNAFGIGPYAAVEPPAVEKLEVRPPYKTCTGCGWTHPRVEASGIYHCPNVFCLASGAFYLRQQAGYHGEDGVLTVEQRQRMISDCRAALEERRRTGTGTPVDVLQRCLKRLEGKEAKP